jgi:hypothetical protein
MSFSSFGPDGSQLTSGDSELLPGHLQADAERGFAPDPEALARVRARVTAEFRVHAAYGAARETRVPTGRRPWRLVLRPAVSLGLAGVLLLASFGLVAANSGPGGPFYGLRLAAEGLGLPFIGVSGNRLDRLQERLDEARRESSHASALNAALRAYQDELERALAEADSDAARQAVLAALATHQVALDELAQTVPGGAGREIDQARNQVGLAQESLRAGSSPTAVPGSSPAPSQSLDRTTRPVESRRPSAH